MFEILELLWDLLCILLVILGVTCLVWACLQMLFIIMYVTGLCG